MKPKLLASMAAIGLLGLLGGCAVVTMSGDTGAADESIKAELKAVNPRGESSMMITKDLIQMETSGTTKEK